MLNPKSSLAALLRAPLRPGRVVWIGLRPGHRKPMTRVQSTVAEVGQGLSGDRYQSRSAGQRQVTLIQAEDLAAIGSYLGRDPVSPELLRRNIVTQGINLRALKDKQFCIGPAVLEYTGECHPCSRMEENLGVGGYNAVRGHGGITARVIEGGDIQVGDEIRVLEEADGSSGA